MNLSLSLDRWRQFFRTTFQSEESLSPALYILLRTNVKEIAFHSPIGCIRWRNDASSNGRINRNGAMIALIQTSISRSFTKLVCNKKSACSRINSSSPHSPRDVECAPRCADSSRRGKLAAIISIIDQASSRTDELNASASVLCKHLYFYSSFTFLVSYPKQILVTFLLCRREEKYH